MKIKTIEKQQNGDFIVKEIQDNGITTFWRGIDASDLVGLLIKKGIITEADLKTIETDVAVVK